MYGCLDDSAGCGGKVLMKLSALIARSGIMCVCSCYVAVARLHVPSAAPAVQP